MTALARIQREFIAAVFADDAADPRIDAYRRNVLGNLRDALAAAYPVVRRLVGDAFFDEAADRFARAHPSSSGDLHRYGEGFAGFLPGYPPARELAYLPDVARLEWAIARAAFDADPRVFAYEELAQRPGSERIALRLELQRAARFIDSPHPLVPIWEANQPDRDGTPSRLAGGARVLVFREGTAVRARELSPHESRFLDALARGATLGEIARDAALAPVLGEQLVQWTRLGVIDGFSSPAR